MHDLVPGVRIVLLNGTAAAENPGVMQQAIELAEIVFDGHRQLVVVLDGSAFEVHRYNGGLGVSGCFNLVIDGFEPGDGASQQDNGRAIRRVGPGSNTTDAASGAGDQNDAILQ